MVALALIVGVILLYPADALAWGPVTHLLHGSTVLETLTTAVTPLQETLARHGLAYLYGCIAPDIMHAKRYTRSVYTHCHCWDVGWQVVGAARTPRQTAFAYGYLSHLASDVYSHNHFVPCRLVTCYEARALRHLYWEARFDAAQPGNRWQLVGHVMAHRYDDCDELVERVVERTLFSFRTNKRIFSSVMAVQQLEQWHAMVRQVAKRSRYELSQREVERFNEICVEAIRDLIQRGREAACQEADPTGHAALARAGVLRQKLRRLRRQGVLPPSIAAEIAALGALPEPA
ncbi:MAG TPA: zinc dependent phospholipase C family protein [Candidatus Limnocylindria bacterium]|nr:zinc dependent phospholipase C family protein [Candidatus Limnocylindria bacterium]